jgi:serine/threonine protein kinase
MNPERWQKINELFQAALEVKPADRDAYLERACGGDEQMKKEVKALLSSDGHAAGILERPAYEAAAEMIQQGEPASIVGRRIGHYRVTGRLGAGGMGEVFLAQDSKLGRRVALKLLPEHYTRDQQKVNRFQQEARAASALNHPNIVTIYEVGEWKGIHYIATEYIEGETLRRRLSAGGMNLGEVLEVASQVAAALSAAHEAGIIHRDIKPENIMVRPDGYVKVLDFGIAKLIERRPLILDTKASTIARVDTDPRVVMGTAHYMSPEQARGLAVDARADVWSFGAVLYEMVSGRMAFEGATITDVLVSVLEREPEPMSGRDGEVPQELQRIVSKALRKDRELRYQTIKDMLADLRSLRQEIEDANKVKRFEKWGSRREMAVATGRQNEEAVTATVPMVVTRGGGAAQTASSTEYLLGKIKGHKTVAVLTMGGLFLVVATIVFGLYKFFNKERPLSQPATSPQTTNMKVLTSRSLYAPAISSDGKYVAYVAESILWVMHVTTGSNVQITDPHDEAYIGLTFSPDNDYIYFVRHEGNGIYAVHRIPVLGGPSKRLIGDVDSPVSFSPDGKQLTFVRGIPSEGLSALLIANSDGTGGERIISKFKNFSAPAWSPDGKTIACGITVDPERILMSVYEVSIADGQRRRISQREWSRIDTVGWDRANNRLLAIVGNSMTRQIWSVLYESGEAQRLTNDLSSYSGLSLTADARSLVCVQSTKQYTIWALPQGQATQLTQVTKGDYDGSGGFGWTSDNRIIYTTLKNGIINFDITDINGTNQKMLTDDPTHKTMPTTSPDGRYIVYVSGKANVYRLDADGSNPKQLTSGRRDLDPLFFSPDGKWVFYTANISDNQPRIWRVGIDGGEAKQIIHEHSYNGTISPDGKLIACEYGIKKPGTDSLTYTVAIVPSEGGEPIKYIDIPGSGIQWTPDGSGIAYLDWRDGQCNIWVKSLDQSPPKQLTNLHTGQEITMFRWSRDGKHLALVLVKENTKLVLITNF